MATRIQEQANGIAYVGDCITLQFRYGMGPELVMRGTHYIPIENPSRFGDWDTPNARKAFFREFERQHVDGMREAGLGCGRPCGKGE